MKTLLSIAKKNIHSTRSYAKAFNVSQGRITYTNGFGLWQEDTELSDGIHKADLTGTSPVKYPNYQYLVTGAEKDCHIPLEMTSDLKLFFKEIKTDPDRLPKQLLFGIVIDADYEAGKIKPIIPANETKLKAINPYYIQTIHQWEKEAKDFAKYYTDREGERLLCKVGKRQAIFVSIRPAKDKEKVQEPKKEIKAVKSEPRGHKLTEQEFRDHSNDYDGFCISCKEVTNFGGTEPDARKYACEVCNKKTVYGIDESLIMGLLEIV